MSKILNSVNYRRNLKLGSRGLFCGCLRRMMPELLNCLSLCPSCDHKYGPRYLRECLRLLGYDMAPVAKFIQTKQCHP